MAACGGDDSASESDDTVVEATTAAPVSEPADAPEPGSALVNEGEMTYLTDAEGTWTLHVTHSESEGPWPLIVVVPGSAGVQPNVATGLAERGAVVVSGENWAPDAAWVSDPDPHVYGAMDRAACIVSWAQAHGADYGADPTVTTVTGFSRRRDGRHPGGTRSCRRQCM